MGEKRQTGPTAGELAEQAALLDADVTRMQNLYTAAQQIRAMAVRAQEVAEGLRPLEQRKSQLEAQIAELEATAAKHQAQYDAQVKALEATLVQKRKDVGDEMQALQAKLEQARQAVGNLAGA